MAQNTTSLASVKNGDAPTNPLKSFSKFMENFKPQLALALPKHMSADRMSRLALTSFSTVKGLSDCTPTSIAASIMTAATLGLEPGVDGQGFLIPYKTTCTFVPGWKGLVDLVSRSGRGTVWTGAVFQGDEFDYSLGDSPFVKHKPGEENDPEKITHVYAIGRVNGSQYPVIEVWTINKVWKHRNKYNKVGNKHYSFRDPEMYARKIPLMQVLKYMPKSIELSKAIALSNAVDEGRGAIIEGDFVRFTDEDAPASRESSGGALTDESTGEIVQVNLGPLGKRIAECKDLEVLEVIAADLDALPQGAERASLEEAYRKRRRDLTE